MKTIVPTILTMFIALNAHAKKANDLISQTDCGLTYEVTTYTGNGLESVVQKEEQSLLKGMFPISEPIYYLEGRYFDRSRSDEPSSITVHIQDVDNKIGVSFYRDQGQDSRDLVYIVFSPKEPLNVKVPVTATERIGSQQIVKELRLVCTPKQKR